MNAAANRRYVTIAKTGISLFALLTVGLLITSAIGCARGESAPPPVRPQAAVSLFNPASMRLHPTFTRVRNWTSPTQSGQPDGIEAELEFSDQFGDPVKAEGRVIFELYAYRTEAADVRGTRISTPFVGSLLTDDEQRARWNRTTRTYSFRLANPNVSPNTSYVLTATFEPRAGGRFYSRIILQPSPVAGN